MAQVDFSKAVLDVNSTYKPMTENDYMYLKHTNYLFDANGHYISIPNVSIILDTPTKVSVLYAGAFGDSGTEFYLGASNNLEWKVSNISFLQGDTYSFIIDIETSGNT